MTHDQSQPSSSPPSSLPPSPPAEPSPPAGSLSDTLIEQLADGGPPPAQLARELGLTLIDLAQWVSQRCNVQTLRGLALLEDLRTQMLLSRFRSSAAARLIEIASAAESAELSRRACADLLKADTGVFDPFKHDDDQPPAAPVLSPEGERALLEALERMGTEEINGPPQPNPPNSGPGLGNSLPSDLPPTPYTDRHPRGFGL